MDGRSTIKEGKRNLSDIEEHNEKLIEAPLEDQSLKEFTEHVDEFLPKLLTKKSIRHLYKQSDKGVEQR
jgi:hypothetical protein